MADMWVSDGNLKEQLKMVFTRYNKAVKSEDILSRCSTCNSIDYTEVKTREMQLTLWT